MFFAIAAFAAAWLGSTLASGQTCLAVCDGGFETCKRGCQTADCIPGCARGYEACKARCERSDVPYLARFSTANLKVPMSFGVPPKSAIRLACVQPPNSCSSARD